MAVRLKAAFTVYDRFAGLTGHLVNLAATLKTPGRLADVWLGAVSRTKRPLAWKDVEDKYMGLLLHIKCDAQAL